MKQNIKRSTHTKVTQKITIRKKNEHAVGTSKTKLLTY